MTFALVMDFPAVHTTGAVMKDYLPLIMGPYDQLTDMHFQTDSTLQSMNGDMIKINDNNGDGVVDPVFNNRTLADTGWISSEPANTVVFDL